MTGAFVDRSPIDWSALLERLRDPGERAAAAALRELDALRARPAGASIATVPGALRPFALALLGIAALQVVAALANAAVAGLTGASLGGYAARAWLTAAFASAGLLLAFTAARDPRGQIFLSTLVLAACAFARWIPAGFDGAWPPLSSPLYFGVYPEALAPAALWRFALVFPAVRRFTRFDVVARRAAAVAAIIGALLFLVNLALAYMPAAGPLQALSRHHPGHLFWHLFAIVTLPALATIAVRAWRAPERERRKVVRCALALAGGMMPLLLTGIARMVFPAFDAWMRAADDDSRLWIDAVIVAGLASVPLLTSAAIVTDRPFELHLRVPRPHRWLDRIGAGRRQRERLAGALERLRLARDPREIAQTLTRELRVAVRARSARLIPASELPGELALMPVLVASVGAVDMSPGLEPFVLLPPAEQAWLDLEGVAMAAAIRLRDGSVPAVLLLGGRRDLERYTRLDRWGVAALLTGAAAAWESSLLSTAALSVEEAVAFECVRCGRLSNQPAAACCDAPASTLAALPSTLGGKFTVRRRLGEGGMGVVYLAEDLSLGRKVALKTLPGLTVGAVDRLRGEARAMASLNHEGLATLYGLEVWRQTPILVVEYFPLGTLDDALKVGPLPARDVLALGIRLADALAYMHAHGVLHRDLKPSNIGLTADGTAKLLDFGLSADADWLVGTPAFLPPEALAGAPPSVAVDLWGLCISLRQALGEEARWPAGFAPFFARALAVDPTTRWQSAIELRTELIRLRETYSSHVDVSD